MDELPRPADGAAEPLRHRPRIAAVYIGAALGPLGGGVVAPMLPQVGQSLGVSAHSAALSLTVYLVPFAAVQLGLSPSVTGVALLGFGLAGLLFGAVWGSVLDRAGARWCGAIAALVTAAFVACVGLIHTPWPLAVCWTAAGAAASMLTVALQNLTVRAVPANRGGALSAVSAFRFTGSAVAPLAWLPLYAVQPAAAFVAAASSLLVAVVALLALRPADPVSGPGSPRRAA